MKILGYRPYHLYECLFVHGATHMKIFKQAVIAQFNWLSGVRRLKKPDCEKWLADYDVSSNFSPNRVSLRKLHHLLWKLIKASVLLRFRATSEWT
jgi:hypothetical protein